MDYVNFKSQSGKTGVFYNFINVDYENLIDSSCLSLERKLDDYLINGKKEHDLYCINLRNVLSYDKMFLKTLVRFAKRVKDLSNERVVLIDPVGKVRGGLSQVRELNNFFRYLSSFKEL